MDGGLPAAEGGREDARAQPRGDSRLLGRPREKPTFGVRLPRRVDACARFSREGGPYGEDLDAHENIAGGILRIAPGSKRTTVVFYTKLCGITMVSWHCWRTAAASPGLWKRNVVWPHRLLVQLVIAAASSLIGSVGLHKFSSEDKEEQLMNVSDISGGE